MNKALILALLLVMSGCTTIKDLQFEESGLEAPSLQVSKALTETMSLELERTTTDGQAIQSLANSRELIHLDELRIFGPAELNTEFELQSTKVGLGITFLEREAVTLKVGFGLSEVDLDLLFKDGPNRYRFSHDNRGAYGRFEVSVPLVHRLDASVHAGLTKFFDEDVGHMSDVGLRLSLSLSDNLQLYAGWFNWFYQNEDLRSEIEIDGEGLIYGLRFDF